jgi:CheY-like chemotaxis protein
VVLRINWSLKNLLRLGLEIRKLGHTFRTVACPAAGRHRSLEQEKTRNLIAVRMQDTHFKILLVDDHQVACRSTAILLELSGHKVRTAFDGRTAMRIAGEFSPNIVILDIGLPDISGYELLSQLKQFKNLETAMFIALTGFEEDTARPSNTGVDFHHFLRKPVDTAELKSILQSS